MLTRALLTSFSLCAATCANAQLVSPVPAAPPPMPEYQPPAPPPPPPPPAAGDPAAAPQKPAVEPDLPPIDLIKRDADGALIHVEGPPAEAVLAAIMPDLKDDEARAKLTKMIEDRRAAVENAVAKNGKIALEAREKLANLDSISGITDLTTINADFQPLYINPPLLEMAQSGKVLTTKEYARAKKALDDYRKAYTRSPDNNVDVLMRANVRFNAGEPLRSIEDLLVRAGERWQEIRKDVGILDDQASQIAAAERQVAAAATPKARADAMAALLAGLSAQQQNAAFAAVAKPAPADLPVAPPIPPKAKPRPTPQPKPTAPAPAKPDGK